MVRFNLVGFGMMILGGVIGLTVSTLLADGSESMAILVGGTIALLADLVYRFRNDQVTGRAKWLGLKTGGFLAIGPVWIVGVILLIYALMLPYVEQLEG